MAEKGFQLTFEERFKLYAIEYLETTMQIEELEREGKNVPEEMHEKKWVLWDNIDFVLAQSVKVQPVEIPSAA